MKINKTKLLFIATLLFLAMPLVFVSSDASAYIGDNQCLKCHEPVTHPGEADKTSYLETAHPNASRPYIGTPLLGPSGGPLTATIGADTVLVHHSWHDGDSARVVNAGGSFFCAPCHTTGYKDSDDSGYYNEASLGITIGKDDHYMGIVDDMPGGSFEYFGVRCEKCHGEATVDADAQTDNCTSGTGLDATYLKYTQSIAKDSDTDGDGDFCDYGGSSGGGGSVAMYSNNYVTQLDGGVAAADFFDCAGDPVTVDMDIDRGTTGKKCGHPTPAVHHGGTYNATTGAGAWLPEGDPQMEATLQVTGQCGECHLGPHHNIGFLNSAHSGYQGPEYDLAEYMDETNYAENHYEENYGSCDGCHDVHVSTRESIGAGEEAYSNRCGVECHAPQTESPSWCPTCPPDYDGRSGFHDGLGGDAPDTTTEDGKTLTNLTGAGTNFDACVACHMPHGNHFLATNLDPDYDAVADGTATVSHGHTYAIPGAGDVYNSFDDVCGNCHAGMVKADVGPAVINNGGYHDLDETGLYGDLECASCHSDKAETFEMTGHYNMLRVLDGTDDGGITNPGGDPYPQDLTGKILAYDGWLGYGSNPLVTVSTKADGESYTCGACHTTGFTPNCSDPTKTSKTACEDADGTWAPDPTKQPSTINAFTDISKISGSWDMPGVRCERCHGTNTTGHDAAAPTDGFAVNALCGECHVGSHANGFLNSPHARFMGTWGELSDETKYDTHFDSRMGCAGCHDVHQSLVVEGAEPFHAECGISCHSYVNLSQTNHPTGPGTPIEDLGNPAVACETCHMKGSGNHLFRINIDPSYSYEIDATTTAGEAECVAQGGQVGSSHGATVCLDATGGHMGRFYPEEGFAEAEWVDLDQACGQCHNASNQAEKGAPLFSVTQLAVLADNMHNTYVSNPDFFVSNTSQSLTVTLSAKPTSCPSAVTCDYEWDFGDGDTDEGATVTHTYTAGGTYSVTMTVGTSAHTEGSVTKSVTPVVVNAPPTGCGTDGVFTIDPADVDQATKSVSFLDNSTDTDGTAVVYVNWGDGSPLEIGSPASSFGPHVYMWNGNYTITKTVRDSGGLTCKAKATVVINPSQGTAVDKYTVTISATDEMIDTVKNTQTRCEDADYPTTGSGAGTWEAGAGCTMPGDFEGDMTCYLKQDGLTKYTKMGNGDGTCTITDVLPGVYDVLVMPAFPYTAYNGTPLPTADTTLGNASVAVKVKK